MLQFLFCPLLLFLKEMHNIIPFLLATAVSLGSVLDFRISLAIMCLVEDTEGWTIR